MVLVDVQTVALQALAGHAGAHHLGQAVVVSGDDAEFLVDLPAHTLGPGLAAEQAVAQRQAVGVDAHLHHGVGHDQGVGRGADQGGGLEVLHDLDLPLGVARGDRDDRGTDQLGAVVQAEAAGEQAVAEGDLDDVVFGDAGGGDHPGHQVGPGLDVVAGVADHGGLARGAGRGMHPHHVAQGHGEQAVGVVVAQVLLDRERQPAQVIERAHVVVVELEFFEFLPVKGDMGAHPVQGRLQPFQLQLFQVFPCHAFLVRFPVHSSYRG